MKGRISKVIAATTAASMVCEVPLPAVEELVAPDCVDPMTFEEDELKEAACDLPQFFLMEGYIPEIQDANSPYAGHPEREYPI